MCEVVCTKVTQIHFRGSKSCKNSWQLKRDEMQWAKDSALYSSYLISSEENNNKENIYKAFHGGND